MHCFHSTFMFTNNEKINPFGFATNAMNIFPWLPKSTDTKPESASMASGNSNNNITNMDYDAISKQEIDFAKRLVNFETFLCMNSDRSLCDIFPPNLPTNMQETNASPNLSNTFLSPLSSSLSSCSSSLSSSLSSPFDLFACNYNQNSAFANQHTSTSKSSLLTNVEYEEIMRDGQTIHVPKGIVDKTTNKNGEKITIYRCALCDKSYKFLGNYRSHARTHTNNAIKCEYCGKIFGRYHSYIEHVLIHRGIKPFQCEKCGKMFRQKHGYKDHIRIHNNEKPFRCTVCNRHFRSSHNLSVHVRIHSNLKPYCCCFCGKTFRQKPALNAHIKKNHKVDKDILGLSREDINKACLIK